MNSLNWSALIISAFAEVCELSHLSNYFCLIVRGVYFCGIWHNGILFVVNMPKTISIPRLIKNLFGEYLDIKISHKNWDAPKMLYSCVVFKIMLNDKNLHSWILIKCTVFIKKKINDYLFPLNISKNQFISTCVIKIIKFYF